MTTAALQHPPQPYAPESTMIGARHLVDETPEQRAQSAEHGVDLLLRSIRRSIDAAKPVSMTAVHGRTDVSALLVLDNGATFERRIAGGRWSWVPVDAVPTTRLAVLEAMTTGRLPAPVTRTLRDRYDFNQTFHGAMRHVLQAQHREQAQRAELEFIREAEGEFPRSHGVHLESDGAQRALASLCDVTDAAISELADQLYDALLAHGMEVTDE